MLKGQLFNVILTLKRFRVDWAGTQSIQVNETVFGTRYVGFRTNKLFDTD